MSSCGGRKARKSVLKPPSGTFEKEGNPSQKRVSFSKRVEIQEYGNQTNECYSATQSSTSCSSTKIRTGSQVSQLSLPEAKSCPIDESVDMDESYSQNTSAPFIFGGITSAATEMDVSMEVVDFTDSTENQPQPNVQSCFPVDEPVDVSMDTAGNMSINMETGSIDIAEQIEEIGPYKENAVDSPEAPVLHVSKAVTSPLDATSTSERMKSPEVITEDHLADFNNTFDSDSTFVSSVNSEEKRAVESLNDHENTSTSSYSNPLSEFNLIRPTPVSFGILDSVKRRSPLKIPPADSLPTYPLAASIRTPLKRVSTVEEFSLSTPGKSSLSFARDKAFTKGLLMGFDTFRTNVPRALDSSKIDQPPIVVRQRFTMEEFIDDLLELDIVNYIDASSFESRLKQIIPVKTWMSGKLDSVSEKFIQRFTDDLLSHYQLIEIGRTVELRSRMGQSAKLSLTENAKSLDFWTKFLKEFNQLTIEQKIQRINSLKDHFYNRICDIAVKRMLSNLAVPTVNIERQLQEKLDSFDRSLQTKQMEIQRLQDDLDSWLEILEDINFIAIKKARENVAATEVVISGVMEERKNLRVQLELLMRSKALKQEGLLENSLNSPKLSTSYYVGLGTSLLTFGPPVPQSKVLESCRRLFRSSEAKCLSIEGNTYKITTFFGLIAIRAACKGGHRNDSVWSASDQEIAELKIEFRKDPTLLDSTNRVGEFAFQRLKENWKMIENNLIGRSLEDATDFLEYTLNSYALLATCLRALYAVGVSVSLKTGHSWKPAPSSHTVVKKKGLWRLCPDFYTFGRALSFQIPPESEPFSISGTIAPKNTSVLLKTEFEVYSVNDLFNPGAASLMQCRDLFGNSRSDLLRKLPPFAKDNIVDVHEHLTSSITKAELYE